MTIASSPIRRRLGATVAAGALSAATLAVGTVAPASAAQLGPDQGLSGSYSNLYQTNDSVKSVVVGGGVIYAGGSFTSVRPPGSAKGSNETARTYVAAFSASTGNLVTTFNPTVSGSVNAVALSADNSTLYIAGNFTKVNNTTRNHFAALSTSTGALTSWNPNATSGNGYAVTAGTNGVYLGGTFTTVGGTAHQDLALVNASTGALNTAFTATADGQVLKMAVTGDGSRLLVVGNFNNIAGQPNHALASVDPATGANQTFAADGVLPNTPMCTATGADLVISGSVAYVAGEGAQPGCFDGDLAINTSDGSIIWNNPCEGATVALAVLNGVLYKGSHMHDCAYNAGGPGGGFTGAFAQGSRKFYRLMAQNPADGSFEHWSPNTNGAGSTHVGPLAMATDGTQLIVAGDFTTVNNGSQQGLARFIPKTTSGGAAPQAQSTAPVATVTGPGAVSVSVPGDWDTDTGNLTYQLYRGTTLVGTQAVESWPWAQPRLRFKVTGLSQTTAYTFRYKVTDGTSTTSYSSVSNSVTASAANSPAAYATTVSGQAPSMWWRLNNGDTSDSATGAANPAAAEGGVSGSTSGIVAGDGSSTLDGSTGYYTSNTPQTLSNTFSASVWFKTSSLSGGTLLGVSSNQTGVDDQGTPGGPGMPPNPAPSPDRAMWMDDSGQIAMAVSSPPPDPNAPPGPPNNTIRSTNTYNDGAWHQAVATYDGTTLSLYVDGQLTSSAVTGFQNLATGFWRAGYVDLRKFNAVFGTNSTTNSSPNSFFVGGSLDEVSVYGGALSATQVAAQYASAAGAL